MSENLEVYKQPAPIAVADARDTDSWITVVRDIIKIADVIYDTPFVPDGLRGSAPAVAAAMLAGREMGLGIMTSLANIDVIRGKPTQKALLMRAMIQSRGHKWEDVDVSDTRVVVRGCRKGESAWAEASFTAEQARRAGIDLGKYPADKLYARATSRLARRKFADVIMGMPYSAEELEDGTADEGTVTDQVAAATGAPKPAVRTARRAIAAKPPADRPTAALSAAASEGVTQGRAGPVPAAAALPDSGLPPLPEEPPDPAAAPKPDTASPSSSPAPGDDRHRKFVGVVHQHFKRLGFADADGDRDERLRAAAKLARADAIESLYDLDPDELSAVAGTLAMCRDRRRLEELLAAAQPPQADR